MTSPARGPLLSAAAVAGGAAAAAACLAADGVMLLVRGPLGLFNDFDIYWSTASVLNHGGDPYSRGAVAAAHDAAGLTGLIGSGYVYPLAFIELVRPLALLPPGTAGAIFTCISLATLAFGVALLLASMPDLSHRKAVFFGIVCGVFPPVAGSLWVGQVNLLLLPALALVYRGIAPGLWIAVAAGVKLYPAAALLALAGRRDRLRQLALAAVTVAALVALPLLLGGGGGFGQKLTGNLTADTYLTNQSTTGFLARMAMSPSWPLRPEMTVNAIAIVVLAAATLAVMWACRFQPWEGALALSICLGTLIAPRNSLWNFTPLLLCFAYAVPNVMGRPRLAGALVVGFALIALQPVVWAMTIPGAGIPATEYANPVISLTSSFGMYGGLVVAFVCAVLLLAPRRDTEKSVGRAGQDLLAQSSA